MGIGGNCQIATGQLQIVAAAQQFPFPDVVLIAPADAKNKIDPTYGVAFTGMEGRRRLIRPTDDIYIGPTSAVSASNGYLVPAGVEVEVFARGPIWFVGVTKAGESSSSSRSPVNTINSSSSLSPVPTSGWSSSGSPIATSGYSQGLSSSSSSSSPFSSSSLSYSSSPFSSSSNVPVATFSSSSSLVNVATFGLVFWLAEFDN